MAGPQQVAQQPPEALAPAAQMVISFSQDPETVTNAMLSQSLQTIGEYLTANADIRVADAEVQTVLALVPMTTFFTCLHFVSDEEDVKTLTRIIASILNRTTYEQLHRDYKMFLIQGLQAESETIRKLALDELLKCRTDETSLALMVNSDVFPCAIDCLSDESTSISSQILKFFIEMAKTSHGCEAIFRASTMQAFTCLLEKNDVVKMRVYDLFVGVSSLSDELFDRCTSSSIMKHLVADVACQDTMLKINILELLQKLARSIRGYQFLEQQTIIQQIVGILAQSPDAPDAMLLVDASLKFLANLAKLKELNYATFVQQHKILGHIEAFLSSKSPQLKDAAVEAIGAIGSGYNGFLVINETRVRTLSGHVLSLTERLLQINQDSAGEAAIGSLNAIGMILNVDTNDEKTAYWTEKLFNGLCANAAGKILEYLRKPFEELRNAAFYILSGISNYAWGRRVIATYTGLADYLLNRSTESSKVGKEWKYTIIQKIARSADAEQVLGSPLFTRFLRYVRDGPFYVDTQPAVAMEAS